MINPITEKEQPDLDDLMVIVGGVTVCRRCQAAVKEFYATDKGYLCKPCRDRSRR